MSMESLRLARRTAAARLDRLPILSVHRKIMWIVGIVFFFEVADVNTFSFAAPGIMREMRALWCQVKRFLSRLRSKYDG